jgi:hypothetical protein
MTTEYFLVDYSGHWQAIKTVGKCLPEFYVVASLAFVVEAVNAIYARTFVIAA